MGHKSCGEGPREPTRSQTRWRWKVISASQATRQRSCAKAAIVAAISAAPNAPCSRKWWYSGYSAVWTPPRALVIQSTTNPSPSASGRIPASVTSRQSRKLRVVFAAISQLANRCVSGDMLQRSKSGAGDERSWSGTARRMIDAVGSDKQIIPTTLHSALCTREVRAAEKNHSMSRSPQSFLSRKNFCLFSAGNVALMVCWLVERIALSRVNRPGRLMADSSA